MARHRWTRAVALAFALAFAVAPVALAQKKQKPAADQDPLDRPRKEKREAAEVYKKWLEQDVSYIITEDEKRAFKKLQTDEEREQFIDIFWRRRDPDPDTEENEYREEHYERIAYANQNFASGIPGWRTDRGRIYIMYGPPHEKESHPMGGQYERPMYHGGGSTSTYPFEVWFYRHLPGVGSGIEIEFVDPTGTGEYRIARSPQEKDAMLHMPGAGLTLAEQLGLSDKSERIMGLGGYGYSGPFARTQDSPFEQLSQHAALMRAPDVNSVLEKSLLAESSSGAIENDPLSFDLRIDFFKQDEGRVVTAFTVQTENKELTFKDVGGVQTAQLNVFGRVTSVAGRRVATFEDPVTTTASVEDLDQKRELKSAYQRLLGLAPGTYKVDVFVRDVNSGKLHVVHQGFTVPRYDAKQLATSTIVLASRLHSLEGQPPVGMFTIGNYKVIPNVSGQFKRGQDVGIYAQIYNAGIDQTTLRPSVDVEYALVKDGKDIFRQAEDWHGLSDSGQRLTLARLLPTNQLAPGDYELQIRIRDQVSGQQLSPTTKFSVSSDK
jgi:GWxTD domain-containing protein